MGIKDMIVLTLHKVGKPLKSAEIAKYLEADRADVDQAIKELRDEMLIESPERSYYVPKK